MQNTNDIHTAFRSLAIEDYMTPLGEMTVTRDYLITALAHARVFSQELEALVELQNVVVSLGSSPSAFGIPGNGFEVCLGLS